MVIGYHLKSCNHFSKKIIRPYAGLHEYLLGIKPSRLYPSYLDSYSSDSDYSEEDELDATVVQLLFIEYKQITKREIKEQKLKEVDVPNVARYKEVKNQWKESKKEHEASKKEIERLKNLSFMSRNTRNMSEKQLKDYEQAKKIMAARLDLS
ncbi:hypothetical protein Tco_1419595 [Tanacetum coccineum]